MARLSGTKSETGDISIPVACWHSSAYAAPRKRSGTCNARFRTCLYQTGAKLTLRGLGATLLMKRARNKGRAVWKMKRTEKRKKNEAREDMETGDTARSGTLSGAPPEYGTSATDFLSQLAPLGLQLLEPHDHHLVTTVEIK